MKSGIDYFSLDVALDSKFELIEAEYGLTGFAVVVKLLQYIYGGQGYYCEWTNEVALLFSRKLGFSDGGNVVSEIVKAAIRRGMFDRGLYEKYGVLTSHGIQKRYFEAVSRRKEIEVLEHILLVEVAQKLSIAYKSSENGYKTQENADNFKQSKVKESKGKESKVKECGNAPPLYGACGNVRLTREQHQSLTDTYEHPKQLIDKLSHYLQSSGKSYRDHYATICLWAEKDSAPHRRIITPPAPLPVGTPMPTEVRENLRKFLGRSF